ncbi:MAG: hypothetical protein P1U85_13120 [Verrucomicrobiales bacterium]|nr:hypothetical protein [Verrucomicrobiales bacterium]
MNFSPKRIRCGHRRHPRSLEFLGATLAFLLVSGSLQASDLPASGVPLPEVLEETDFDELKNQSPFVRTLDPSESLILVGLAKIDGELVATLRERVTKKTHILTSKDNEEGWRIVGVDGDLSDLGTVEAQISFAEQVYAIRYDQQMITPPTLPKWRRTIKLSEKEQKYVVYQAQNFRRGISGDGYRGATPPALADKLSRISQGQREEIIARLRDMDNRGISSEDRQKAAHQMTDRAIRAR